MRRFAALSLIVSGALAPLAIADLNEDVRAALEATRLSISIDEDGLGGPGGAWLVEQAAEAKFTLLGEAHLNAETPAFTQALLHELRPHGYGAYVVECGPESTRIVVDLIASAGVDAAKAHCAADPFSIAFLDHVEEMIAVREALELGYAVWGIDQEFVGSPRHLLKRLIAVAPDAAARVVAENTLARAQAGFERFATQGDQSAGFIFSATDADYDALADAFEGVAEAEDIIEQLRASTAIYRAYGERRYYDNNSTRIELMKRNLLRHIERAGMTPLSMPKAVFKAGTNHMGKGHTPMHVLDVGNFASELAIASGSSSLHVFVTAAGMTGADGEFTSWLSQAPHLEALYAQAEDGPVVVDLRPLRAVLTQRGGKSEEQKELQRVALSFDVAVVFPQFTPATGLYPMPGR